MIDRRTFIGGSDAAAVMGFGAYGATPYSVYLSKTGAEAEEIDPARKRFLERRKRWEPVVVQMLREELEAEVVAINQRHVDKEHDFLACEIDFEWRDEDGSVQNGEIKSVSPFAFGERQGWGEAGTDEVPVHYAAQVMHGLMVTGRQVCVVAAMVGLDNMVFYRIERDEETIAAMRAKLEAFWNNNVLAKVAPDPQSLQDIHRMFTKSNGLEVSASSEVGSKALQLRALVAQVDALELQRESLEFDVKLAMRENESLTVDGKRVMTWKNQKWSRLDQAGLKESEKDIYRKYLKSGTQRVFRPLRS